jgi:hypothetical protein
MTTAGKWRAFLASYEPPMRTVPGEIRFETCSPHEATHFQCWGQIVPAEDYGMWCQNNGLSAPAVLWWRLVENTPPTAEFSFENGLQVFLHAFVCMAQAVTVDWRNPDTGYADYTGDVGEVLAAMASCACGVPDQGLHGHIHPEFTPDNERMFGAWSF